MDEAMWAFGRVSGIVALALITVSVILGIVTRSGRPVPGMPRFSIVLVHRNVAIMASVFVVLHVGMLMLDSFAKLNPVDIVVPFLGSFKPFWQGLGTVAVDLLIAILASSLLRRWLGVRIFRAIHWFTYAMWPIALIHAIGNGTNGTSPWFLVSAAVACLLVALAIAWRISAGFIESSKARAEHLR
jgi:Predicted ferric reductase